MSRLLLTLLVGAGVALAQDEASERAAVRERLVEKRAALALLESRKVSVLEALELVERRAASSVKRVRTLERDLALFRQRLALAEHEDEVTREVLRQHLRRLSPRLWGMYRLMRRRPIEALMSARDFSALVWRSRALKATMESDLRLLRTVQRVERLRRQAARELRGLQASLDTRLTFLREQAALAQAQREVLEELVGHLNGQAELARRVVRELEQADAELTQLLKDMTEELPSSGFGALRGKLPLPAAGTIEVGFGKVVNPRFRTVTVQKGLDLRAPAGAPVRAVADGTVAYAGWLRGYGNLLILDHGDGFHTLMAHLASIAPAVGARLAAGEVVGEVGDTGSLKGAYLYFEIRRDGQAVDPALWLAPAR